MKKIGIITSGACYQYAKESFATHSFLKLGMVYPLPITMIREFAAAVTRLYVFEELDPFFEEQIKSFGIEVTGKDIFPLCGEFNPTIAEEGIRGPKKRGEKKPLITSVPPRPPNMCPGCPHRGIFYTLKKQRIDIQDTSPADTENLCVSPDGKVLGHTLNMRGWSEVLLVDRAKQRCWAKFSMPRSRVRS